MGGSSWPRNHTGKQLEAGSIWAVRDAARTQLGLAQSKRKATGTGDAHAGGVLYRGRCLESQAHREDRKSDP